MLAGMRRLVLLTCLAVALAALAVGAAQAAAPTIKNGGFETGSLKGWKNNNGTRGKWVAYTGDFVSYPQLPKRGMSGAFVHKPPRGKYAAIATESGPCTTILYQDFTVPKHATLKLIAYYKSQADMTTRPDLDAEDDMADNQQYRIDLMKPDADIRSLDSGDIYKNVFRTRTGDARKMDPTKFAVDLGKLAGKTVRLRVAQTDNQAPLLAAVDGVKVKVAK